MQSLIAGVDEVGRGAWAGPIVAAAVILNTPILGLKDSKVLSAHVRQNLSDQIQHTCISFAIAELSPSIIDEIGIAEANRLVMRRAIDQLKATPSLVRIDGFSCHTTLNEEVYIKGDTLFSEISAASILAKVYRDNLMNELHTKYPNYGFDRHVGYGTKIHKNALDQYGPTPHHRLSFKPMKTWLQVIKSASV